MKFILQKYFVKFEHVHCETPKTVLSRFSKCPMVMAYVYIYTLTIDESLFVFLLILCDEFLAFFINGFFFIFF